MQDYFSMDILKSFLKGDGTLTHRCKATHLLLKGVSMVSPTNSRSDLRVSTLLPSKIYFALASSLRPAFSIRTTQQKGRI